MTSVNPHYTFNYSQPEDYRFSHDSVFLAREAFTLTRGQNLANTKVLDLCAGSGIVGLDFLFHRAQAGLSLPSLTDFLEVQEIYRPHFEANTET
ncbi:MAG: methyltransferase, partial [Bdellovibrionaceae bacterium]|nr:methyltransferase [Pseudobdellovibrionaceae bacterium]